MKILFLGIVGFPYGLAPIKKIQLIAKALQRNQNTVVEVVSYTSYNKSKIKKKGTFDGINYRYTSLFTSKGKNSFSRRLNSVFGRINEIFYLLTTEYDFVIVSCRNALQIFLYVFAAKIRKKKIILTSVEDKSVRYSSSKIFGQFHNYFYQEYVWKIVDGALPISENLKEQIYDSNPSLPQLKLPVLVDLEPFNKEHKNPEDFKYYLFCGDANYFQTIRFIIDGFAISKIDKELVLIINGIDSSLKKVKHYIKQSDCPLKIICITTCITLCSTCLHIVMYICSC